MTTAEPITEKIISGRTYIQSGNRTVVVTGEPGNLNAYLYVNTRHGFDGGSITSFTWSGKTMKGARAFAARHFN